MNRVKRASRTTGKALRIGFRSKRQDRRGTSRSKVPPAPTKIRRRRPRSGEGKRQAACTRRPLSLFWPGDFRPVTRSCCLAELRVLIRLFARLEGNRPSDAEFGLDRLNQSRRHERPLLPPAGEGIARPRTRSRSEVSTNRSALSSVLGGQGRTRTWRMARSLSASAKRRERQADPFPVIRGSARMPGSRNRRRARRPPARAEPGEPLAHRPD